mmetsp:Transcript_77957/g.206910  ORF Transcript_77957/g.206910 Transcript_77957/m.206910 type:complete len:275 (-) Transcript_77957:192-1016(-)
MLRVHVDVHGEGEGPCLSQLVPTVLGAHAHGVHRILRLPLVLLLQEVIGAPGCDVGMSLRHEAQHPGLALLVLHLQEQLLRLFSESQRLLVVVKGRAEDGKEDHHVASLAEVPDLLEQPLLLLHARQELVGGCLVAVVAESVRQDRVELLEAIGLPAFIRGLQPALDGPPGEGLRLLELGVLPLQRAVAGKDVVQKPGVAQLLGRGHGLLHDHLRLLEVGVALVGLGERHERYDQAPHVAPLSEDVDPLGGQPLRGADVQLRGVRLAEDNYSGR